jgi:hypothetical protein
MVRLLQQTSSDASRIGRVAYFGALRVPKNLRIPFGLGRKTSEARAVNQSDMT